MRQPFVTPLATRIAGSRWLSSRRRSRPPFAASAAAPSATTPPTSPHRRSRGARPGPVRPPPPRGIAAVGGPGPGPASS